MTQEYARKLRELELDRKTAQDRLYQLFINSPMTVRDYDRRSYQIDMKYAREEAYVILAAIMQADRGI